MCDHKQRPTKIEVVCPNCGGCAVATEPAYDRGCLIIGDTSLSWDKPAFSVMCTGCFFRMANQHYNQLAAPYHQISVSGRTLWAWNEEHLDMLKQVLEGRSVKDHPYAFFATYVHRGWQQWRKKFLRAIQQHSVMRNQAVHRARRDKAPCS